LDLRTLRYFVAIADAGSLNAAAATISIAQPALTRAMRELERSVGVALLHRTSRGVRLTAAGVSLYAAAQRMLSEAQRIRQELEGHTQVRESLVTLGAPPTLARVLVPGIFETCRRKVGMRLSVRESFTPVLIEWLGKGLIDVAVITKTATTARAPLLLQPLLAEPFALVTQRSLGVGPIVRAADVPQLPLLMTTLHREIVSQQLAAVGIRLTIEAEIDSVDCIRELLLRGHGATLMPISVFKPPGSSAKLTLSEISGVQLNRQLLMATRAENDGWPLIAALKELILEESGQLVGQGLFSFSSPRKRGA
jgi:LysR family transcriptional regulator, nitrogen assimilation regulatory protein